jgi:hypothetical protein
LARRVDFLPARQQTARAGRTKDYNKPVLTPDPAQSTLTTTMSDLAAKLILENRATQAPFLDLANCGLSRLPLELGELVWLETLALADGWLETAGQYQRVRKSPNQQAPNQQLKNLAALAPLKRLHTLYLNDTGVTDLTGLAALSSLRILSLAHNPLTDLSALTHLKQLEWLNLAETRVRDLRPLSQLARLQWLKLSGSEVMDLGPLSGLHQLSTLELDKTPVADISALSTLSALATLILTRSQVSDLSPLADLPALTTLNLSHTPVADLTPLRGLIGQGRAVVLKAAMWGNDGITVEGCPLTHPPPEQVAQGKQAMLAWFAAQKKQDVAHWQEAKLLVFGRPGPDTARLLRQFRVSSGHPPGDAASSAVLGPGNSTLGLESPCEAGPARGHYDFIASNGYPFRLHIWHIDAQLHQFAALPGLLSLPSLFLLLDQGEGTPGAPVADVADVADVAHAAADTAGAAGATVGTMLADWLNLIGSGQDPAQRDATGNGPILLFRQQSGAHSLHLQDTPPGLQACYGGDLTQVDNARALRVIIEEALAKLPLLRERVPGSWLKIRQALDAAPGPLIAFDDFLALCQTHWPEATPEEADGQARQLCARLHACGAILHFPTHPRLGHWLITDVPQVLAALYRLQADATIGQHNGRFTSADCQRIWPQAGPAPALPAPALPPHSLLLDLMQQLELAGPLPKQQAWLRWHELPPQRHDSLRKWQTSGDWVGLFQHRCVARALVPRLMMRLCHFVAEPEKASVRCLLLQHGSSFVLVEVSGGRPEVRLSARGPARDALLKIVQTELTAINHGQPLLRIRSG